MGRPDGTRDAGEDARDVRSRAGNRRRAGLVGLLPAAHAANRQGSRARARAWAGSSGAWRRRRSPCCARRRRRSSIGFGRAAWRASACSPARSPARRARSRRAVGLALAMFAFGAHVGACAPAIPKVLAAHVPATASPARTASRSSLHAGDGAHRARGARVPRAARRRLAPAYGAAGALWSRRRRSGSRWFAIAARAPRTRASAMSSWPRGGERAAHGRGDPLPALRRLPGAPRLPAPRALGAGFARAQVGPAVASWLVAAAIANYAARRSATASAAAGRSSSWAGWWQARRSSPSPSSPGSWEPRS